VCFRPGEKVNVPTTYSDFIDTVNEKKLNRVVEWRGDERRGGHKEVDETDVC